MYVYYSLCTDWLLLGKTYKINDLIRYYREEVAYVAIITVPITHYKELR